MRAVADKLVLAGRKGQKTQKGFYDYTRGRAPERDAAVEELIVATSAELGIQRREISEREIVERCVLGLVNGSASLPPLVCRHTQHLPCMQHTQLDGTPHMSACRHAHARLDAARVRALSAHGTDMHACRGLQDG